VLRHEQHILDRGLLATFSFIARRFEFDRTSFVAGGFDSFAA
jgi:hypothetical protein